MGDQKKHKGNKTPQTTNHNIFQSSNIHQHREAHNISYQKNRETYYLKGLPYSHS